MNKFLPKNINASSIETVTHSTEELLHELQVHQIELEMQNDELRRTQVALEESRNRYIDLYDFAPVGYVLLTPRGLIAEINLTAAELLGVDRKTLLSRRFATMVSPSDSDQWHLFFSKVMKQNQRKSIELALKGCNDSHFSVQLDCLYINSMLRITLTDITKIKQVQAALHEAEALALINTEHLKREKAQEEARYSLSKIASRVPGMLYQFRLRADGSSCFPYASDGIKDIYRLSPDDVIEDASKIFSRLHPDDYDDVCASIYKSAQTITPWQHEYRVRFDDGTIRWLYGNAIPEQKLDSDGSLLWHGFITDISAQKKEQEAIHLNAQYSRSLIEASLDPLVTISPEGKITDVNKATEQVTGVIRSDLIGSDFTAYFTNTDEARKGYEKVFSQGFVTDYPLAIRHISGTITDVLYNASLYHDSNGHVLGIFAAARDITESEVIKKALVASETLFKTMFMEAPLGIALIGSLTGQLYSINPMFANIAGRTMEEMIGINWMSITHPDDVQEDLDNMALLNTGEISGFHMEKRYLHPNGTAVWINMAIASLYIQDKAHPRHLCMIEDITERKRAEDKEKLYLEEFAHVTRLGLMGQMASGIAHEVNQPLCAIVSYTQVSINLLNRENPDLIKIKEVLSKTQEQALRAGRIIHRMKEFGKSNTQHHLNTEINRLIYDASDFCITELKHNNVKLSFELINDLPPVVVDHIQIEQVIINLIRNSVEALQDLPKNTQRQITIHSHLAANNSIQVSVEDNGLGIDENTKQKILTPFHTTKKNGTGMGLSISRALIEAYGGTLNFNSQLGKGSTFYFTLPIETAGRESTKFF